MVGAGEAERDGLVAALHASATLASKGRLIRCTVPGSTPNRSAILRTPGLPGVATAFLIRSSTSEAIRGRPSRFTSILARASLARKLFCEVIYYGVAVALGRRGKLCQAHRAFGSITGRSA